MNISKEIRDAAEDAESALGEVFADIERVSRICTERVLDAFSEYRVSEAIRQISSPRACSARRRRSAARRLYREPMR